MRAVVHERYGQPEEVLRLDEVPVPAPSRDQVLIEVAATSINLSDWESLTGSPAYARIGGLLAPKRTILGSDIAGRVATVGADVTEFAVGDEVYADNLWLKGGFAQFAVVPAAEVAHRPAELTAAQASTVPQAGAIAIQGTTPVGDGSRVLINGAGGGSGAFAIQLAKAAGAHVTGVDNEQKLDHMMAVGADEVIDYRQQDFTLGPQRYDVILDLVAKRSAFAYRRALAPGGHYRCVGGSVGSVLQALTLGGVLGMMSGRNIGVLGVRQGPQSFEPLGLRCAAGEIDVHIDRTFTLDEVPEALAYVGRGQCLGKAVVMLEEQG